VQIGGKDVTVAEINSKIAAAVKKSDKFVNINGESFTTNFLGKLAANPDVKVIGSKFRIGGSKPLEGQGGKSSSPNKNNPKGKRRTGKGANPGGSRK
jgi:hypothetical protein